MKTSICGLNRSRIDMILEVAICAAIFSYSCAQGRLDDEERLYIVADVVFADVIVELDGHPIGKLGKQKWIARQIARFGNKSEDFPAEIVSLEVNLSVLELTAGFHKVNLVIRDDERISQEFLYPLTGDDKISKEKEAFVFFWEEELGDQYLNK